MRSYNQIESVKRLVLAFGHFQTPSLPLAGVLLFRPSVLVCQATVPLNASELESILKRVHEWTWRIDTKVQIFVAIEVFSLGAIVPTVVKWLSDSGHPVGLKVTAYFGLGMIAVSIAKNVQALFPRGGPFEFWTFVRQDVPELAAGLFKATGRTPKEPRSFTYFGHIGAMTLQQYRELVDSVDTGSDQMRNELIEQAHVCSVILNKKLHDLKVSIFAFTVGVAVLCGTYLFG